MTCSRTVVFLLYGDGLWEACVIAIRTRLAISRNSTKTGLAQPGDIVDGCVVRQPKAYPVYDDDYAGNVAVIREELDAQSPELCSGFTATVRTVTTIRTMLAMTAMLCVENILAGKQVFDLWQVNQDAEYRESGNAGAGGLGPCRGRWKPAVPSATEAGPGRLRTGRFLQDVGGVAGSSGHPKAPATSGDISVVRSGGTGVDSGVRRAFGVPKTRPHQPENRSLRVTGAGG